MPWHSLERASIISFARKEFGVHESKGTIAIARKRWSIQGATGSGQSNEFCLFRTSEGGDADMTGERNCFTHVYDSGIETSGEETAVREWGCSEQSLR